MTTPVKAARSGPRRARLKVKPPAARLLDIEVCFNPTAYKVGKTNTFAEIAVPGRPTPAIQYIRGGSETLTVELLADTTDTGDDVRKRYTDPIRALMDQDPALRAPPIVEFHWDRGVFTGVVEKVDLSFDLFDPDGVPLRATIGLSLKEFQSIGQQLIGAAAGVAASHLVQSGDTLSALAGRLLGDVTDWRSLARVNGIADPRRLVPGQVLQLPRPRGIGGLF